MSEAGSAPNDVVTGAIDLLCDGQDLSSDLTESVLLAVMNARVNESQVAAFLIALRAKGETEHELCGLATAMREMSTKVQTNSSNLVDTAGTGGGRTTFNVSTTAALIAAGAGCAVAKHGNRSATSLSGSADLLEALGVKIDLGPDAISACIDEVGFGFMFAPSHHPATKYVVPVRKALGTRTVFNLLGPLTNPAGAPRQVVGVSDPNAVGRVARALALLGTERAVVVHGEDGLDELSLTGASLVFEVRNGEVSQRALSPEDVGLEPCSAEAISGGDPAENAAITRSILSGEAGPRGDFAILNAAAAILVSGEDDDLAGCVARARESVESGAAMQVLEELVEFTNTVGTDDESS